MGGSSSNGNTSAGTTGTQPGSLSSLFMNNQAAPHVSTPTIAAPQSMLGQGGAMPPMQSSQSPINYTPPPAQTLPFRADPSTPGYGWMKVYSGSEHGQPQYSMQYVSAPQQPQQAPYQPSTASLLAAAMNKGK